MNYTIPVAAEDTSLKSQEILLIASTIITLLLSGIDVLINAMAHNRDKKLKLELCECLKFNYESGSDEDKVTLPK